MVPSPDTGLLCPHGWPKIPGCRMRGNSEQQPSECPQNCAGVTVNTHEKQKDGKLTLCRFCIILEEPTVAHRSSALLLLWWLFPARKGGGEEQLPCGPRILCTEQLSGPARVGLSHRGVQFQLQALV